MYVVMPRVTHGVIPALYTLCWNIRVFYVVDLICRYEKVDAGLHVW